MGHWPKDLITYNRDGTTQYSDKIAAAKSMLKHYFWLAMGEKLDSDNYAEIEGIVDDLYDGILEDIKNGR